MSTLARRQGITFYKSKAGGLLECIPHCTEEPDGSPVKVWEPAQLRIIGRQRARKLRRRRVQVHTVPLHASPGKFERFWFALIQPPAVTLEDWS